MTAWLLLLALLAQPAPATPAAQQPTRDLFLVLGAPGAPEYERLFATWMQRWETAAQGAGVRVTVIGRDEAPQSDRDRLQAALQQAGASQDELWLVLIGHGTFDRRTAKFNLRGPDLSSADLKDWLAPLKRPVAIIDCSAASAPFLSALAGPQRIIVTATKGGGEQNFARFGDFLSEAIVDPTADLDKDDQVSLWEAFLAASRRTAEFYKTDGRLLTEHALLDDNGDGQGTRADAFHGLQPVQTAAKAGEQLDGARAHQWHLVRAARDQHLPPDVRSRRDALELQVLALREQKSQLPEDEYYRRLEVLLVDLARLSRAAVKETPRNRAVGF